MRNYIWLSEFRSSEQIYNLESFDDEFFILLKNNQPVFIAFPEIINEEFNNKFNYKADIISARDLINKTIHISDWTVLHIIKDNKKYYNIIPYWRAEACFIEETLIKKIREEHLAILKK